MLLITHVANMWSLFIFVRRMNDAREADKRDTHSEV